ncbi:MAG: triose-phosphate isomerase [Chloroherpetonaceae bacterium]|jgi:triosephosphate isomerase|nr:triose-phosphate isomerase [Bacteroidota bacterium]
MRNFIIAGNWKMNMNNYETKAFIGDLNNELKNFNFKNHIDIIICPPFTSLSMAKDCLTDSVIKLGAQNMHYQHSGAFTGEISPSMLTEFDCEYVIIGHSERRQYFNESDEMVQKKIRAALERYLTPILCIGETLQERDNGQTFEVLSRQIDKGLDGIPQKDFSRLVVAYEPVWAIGTGLSASSLQISEVHKWIKSRYFSEGLTPILYGGSINEGNAREILSLPQVDGGLIGGASLKVSSFLSIINIANSIN